MNLLNKFKKIISLLFLGCSNIKPPENSTTDDISTVEEHEDFKKDC